MEKIAKELRGCLKKESKVFHKKDCSKVTVIGNRIRSARRYGKNS